MGFHNTLRVRKLIWFCFSGLIFIFSGVTCDLQAGEKVYDRNWRLQYRVEGNRVYDRNWKLRYRLREGKIYDRHWRLQGRIEDNQIYDRQWRRLGTIRGNRVYNRDWRLKYRRQKSR